MHEIPRFQIRGRGFQYHTVFPDNRATWQNRKPRKGKLKIKKGALVKLKVNFQKLKMRLLVHTKEQLFT